jgi:hypothetical protein
MESWTEWLLESLELSKEAEAAGLSKEAYMQVMVIEALTQEAEGIHTINSRRSDYNAKAAREALLGEQKIIKLQENERQIRVLAEIGRILTGRRLG